MLRNKHNISYILGPKSPVSFWLKICNDIWTSKYFSINLCIFLDIANNKRDIIR